MADGIHSYHPQVHVTLVKCVQEKDGAATRYVKANNRIDLTPFLSENGSVTTHKDITQPVGTFAITFADQVDQRARDSRSKADSVYGIVAPMDYIEIRMARSPVARREDYGRYLPIIMRGFVSTVRRAQQMGDDGQPVRSVVIKGQDFGKLLSILQIFYERNYGLGQNLVTRFLLSQNYNVMATSYPAGDFMREIVNSIVNPAIKGLWQDSALHRTLDAALTIRTEGTISVSQGVIQPYVFQGYRGNIWGLMKQFADLKWNEMFLDERPDGVYLVYRPFPFFDINDKIIPPGADPGSTPISLQEIVSLETERSDSDVANYFWVNAPHYQSIGPAMMQDYAYSSEENYLMDEYPNNDPTLYGIRKAEVQTAQGNTNEQTSGADQRDGEQQESVGNMWEWLAQRRRQLKAYNKDNVLFETGSIVLRGNESARPGRYLNIDYGAFHARYYAQAITQTFIPFRKFTTKARVIRGTGYIQRTRLDQSPYYAERGSGVYD